MIRNLISWFGKKFKTAPNNLASVSVEPVPAKRPEEIHFHWHFNPAVPQSTSFFWNAKRTLVNDAPTWEKSVTTPLSPSTDDDYLLERARTQWQFGDWDSLASLDKDAIQCHHDRAKLALLAAAGHMQKGNNEHARQFTGLALEWGCSKKLVSQILIAGVYNNIGRAAAVAGQHSRSLKHFENAVSIGMPESDVRLISHVRIKRQLSQINDLQTAVFPIGIDGSAESFIGKGYGISGSINKEQSNSLIRSIHHFSCTGGTLFAKCLASLPNVVLLNEVDPFSQLSLLDDGTPQFSPRDIISLLHQSGGKFNSELIGAVFCKDIETIQSELAKTNNVLILRDHTHSAYLVGKAPRDTKPLRELLKQSFKLKSIVTVRNPIDSYLSLKELGWIYFEPPTFNEYCLRYLCFLADYQDVKVVRYEDFVQDSLSVMNDICRHLELEYSEDFINKFADFKFSGDSGRRGNVIEPRPRRPYTDGFVVEVNNSEAFARLAKILGYEPNIN